MIVRCRETQRCASRSRAAQAFSLVELVAVVALVGMLAAAGIMRFGFSTVDNLSGEGFARKLALDLIQARRRTIATGDNHYLQLSPSAGNFTSYVMYRRASGGDVVVEQPRTRPTGVTASSSHATLEFDFDGAALAAYSASVVGPNRTWTVSTVMATGSVQTATSP
jgi:prepilin-type N-terminal cleavage/methylation domain-containing protein